MRMEVWRSSRVVVLAIIWIEVGCSGAGTQGVEGKPCYPNGTCNAGLACAANRCTRNGASAVASPALDAGLDAQIAPIDAGDSFDATQAPKNTGAAGYCSPAGPGFQTKHEGDPCYDINECVFPLQCNPTTSPPCVCTYMGQAWNGPCQQDSDCMSYLHCDISVQQCVECMVTADCIGKAAPGAVCMRGGCFGVYDAGSSGGTGGGGAGGSGGSGGAGAQDAGPDTSRGIWGKVNGKLEGDAYPLVAKLMGANGFQIADTYTFNVAIVWSGTAGPGSYPCSAHGPPDPGAGLAYNQYWASWGSGGGCSVTLTEVGTQSGARIVGTFSGTVVSSNHTPSSYIVTEGRFAVSMP
jgi:hypothetical protein